MTSGPAFIGIGAQKAGTTWLWENLREHPQLWLPLIKELHWFDVRYPPASLAASPPYRHRTGFARYRPLWRHPSWFEARWIWHFYHSLRNDADYLALFDRQDARLAGEITPAYATLDAGTVQHLHEVLPPDCRMVLMLREPIDRLWSGVRMHCRKRGMDWRSLPEDEVVALAAMPAHALRSDYAYTLQNWAPFADRLGVFFYEDMQSSPHDFLSGVLRFLQVDAAWRSPKAMKVSNAGQESNGVPAFFREHWQPRYQPVVQAVERHVGRVPDAWKVSA
ncbi:MAG TPA: sulfotransferase [Pseudomonadales bacterium]|jgi:hypothetical protein